MNHDAAVPQRFGGGCVRQGETEVVVYGLVTEVRPNGYAVVRLPHNTACTSELAIFTHTAALTFPVAGDAVVRIVGLSRPGDEAYEVVRWIKVAP